MAKFNKNNQPDKNATVKFADPRMAYSSTKKEMVIAETNLTVNDIFNNEVLKRIAENHHKSVSSVILRWLNQRNIVVIPKTVRKERMIENFNIFDFTISDDEMQAIAALNTGNSPIYDDMDLPTVRFISSHRIHD